MQDLPARFRPGRLRVEALAHFPIERDLVVGIDDFIVKLESIKPYLVPRSRAASSRANTCRPLASSSSFEQFSSCINCLLCYAACPQYGLDSGNSSGPGALALLHRYNADSRDGARARAHGDRQCRGRRVELHRRGYCSEVCPKHVDPANAVNQNKVNSANDYFLRFVARKERAARRRTRLPAPDGGLVAARSLLRALHGRARPPPLALAAYALVLLRRRACAWRRARPPSNGWLRGAAQPGLHRVAPACCWSRWSCTRQSWFEIMPKTMPMIFVGGTARRRRHHHAHRPGRAVAAALALFALAWMLKP